MLTLMKTMDNKYLCPRTIVTYRSNVKKLNIILQDIYGEGKVIPEGATDPFDRNGDGSHKVHHDYQELLLWKLPMTKVNAVFLFSSLAVNTTLVKSRKRHRTGKLLCFKYIY